MLVFCIVAALALVPLAKASPSSAVLNSADVQAPGDPAADAGPNQTVVFGETVKFDGSGSSDDLGIVNYTWVFTYDDEEQLLYGVSPEFTFSSLGSYFVNLTVTDSSGNHDTDSMSITVEKNLLMKYWPWLLVGALVAIVALQLVLARRKKGFVSPKSIARYGVLTALTAAVTMATFVPFAPTKGYFNLGDSIVFFSGLTLGMRAGGICGGFGSAVADILLGSGFFAPLTLVAKGSEGAVSGAISRLKVGSKLAIVLGIALGGTCMVLSYFIGELFLLNVGLGAALFEAAGNTIQVIVGGSIGALLSNSVKRAYPKLADEQ
jgi:uncharacterized membrane protein